MNVPQRPLALVDDGREPDPARKQRDAAIAAAAAVARSLVDNVETVVQGKRGQVELVVAAAAADGHVLLEDVPGTAKTVLARALAQSIDGAVAARIQCTPDLQ